MATFTLTDMYRRTRTVDTRIACAVLNAIHTDGAYIAEDERITYAEAPSGRPWDEVEIITTQRIEVTRTADGQYEAVCTLANEDDALVFEAGGLVELARNMERNGWPLL